jgi:uncharacterized lipoprotein
MMKRILLAVCAVVLLSACGIKPGDVKAPKDSKTVYPRTYPAPDAQEINR